MKANYTIVSIAHNRKLNALIVFRLFIILSLVVIICLSLMGAAFAQTSLKIPKKGEFKLDQDTLVFDELIIGDSAKITLTTPSSMIKVRHLVIGVNVRIMGLGGKGGNGKNGRTAAQPEGVCKPGRPGEGGKPGTAGNAGKDFMLEVDQLTMESPVIFINLGGGNGGDGGAGGEGSQGSNSTSTCVSHGGNGGNGGNGGDGGRGGIFTLIVRSHNTKDLLTKFNLYNRGGYKGVGGDGGAPGQRGHGASSQSKSGLQGTTGVAGSQGIDGKVLFYSILQAKDTGTTPVGSK